MLHSNLTFVTTDLYQFRLQQGGQFYLGDQYGSIHPTKFSIKSNVQSSRHTSGTPYDSLVSIARSHLIIAHVHSVKVQ